MSNNIDYGLYLMRPCTTGEGLNLFDRHFFIVGAEKVGLFESKGSWIIMASLVWTNGKYQPSYEREGMEDAVKQRILWMCDELTEARENNKFFTEP